MNSFRLFHLTFEIPNSHALLPCLTEVLSLHMLSSVCAAWRAGGGDDVSGQWGLDFAAASTIPEAVLLFAYKFCDHAEKVWAALDFARKGHSLPDDDTPTPATVPTQPQRVAPVAPRGCDFLALARSMQGATTGPGKADLEVALDHTTLHASMVRFLQALPNLGLTGAILLDIMKSILGLNGAWFFWGMSDASKRRCQRATHDSCKDLTQFSVFVACLLLQSLGLASCFQSVRSAGGGRPIWLLCKKPAEDWMRPLLSALGVSGDTVPNYAAYKASVEEGQHQRPSRAPVLAHVAAPPPGEIAEVAELLKLGWPEVPPTEIDPPAPGLAADGGFGVGDDALADM